MITLEKKESIYFLNLAANENRWNTIFVREIAKALDEIEFTGWSTAEVGGGNRMRIKEIHDRMNKYLLGKG